MRPSPSPTRRRAVGIIRVSKVGDRSGASFTSPDDQRARIQAFCDREGLELIDVREELDVSGGLPLARRRGLRWAVEAVEEGKAQVVVAAYLDRLVRSLRVQDEITTRVERAGGQAVALDFGALTNGSAARWLSGTVVGAMAEYYRRSVSERLETSRVAAVERGACPFPNIPPGYVRGPDGVLARDPNPVVVATVVRAFEMRAAGQTVASVRAHLREHGIKRSYHGVCKLLTNRMYIGEIRFGELVNPAAHEPLISAELFRRAQQSHVVRGRRPKSDHLLARTRVLICETCGHPMSLGSAKAGKYPTYRCSPTGDCPKRMAISAAIAEEVVVEVVKRWIADEEGRASAESGVQAARDELAQAQAALDNAIELLAGLTNEPAAFRRLAELREARDAAQECVDQLGADRPEIIVGVDDWDDLSLDEQRALLRAVVVSAVVGPGRGRSRITVKLLSEIGPSRERGAIAVKTYGK